MIFAPWPYFDNDEIQAAIDVLKSGNVNQWTGDEINLFEKEFAEYVGVRYSVALSNGSLALDIALRVLDIQPGDEVIVSPRSFIASASCVCLRGATPVFVDVDPVSQNITPENIEAAVTPKTRAVIAVNLAGWPCRLDEIKSLCRQKQIYLIEDCAQAHGASFKGKKAGSYGDCAIFSFCQDKIMTTGGEGGMLLTSQKKIWEKVWSYKDHGKNPSKAFDSHPEPGFRWLVDSFGTNCRLTEIQAAIGRVMLGKLDVWVDKRRTYARKFDRGLENVPGIRTTVPGDEVVHSYYKYYLFIDPDQLKSGWDRDRIMKSLNSSGIPCNTGICPEIYLEEVFKHYPFRLVSHTADNVSAFLPVARALGETSMMFMLHPTLSPESIDFVIDRIRQVMKQAVK